MHVLEHDSESFYVYFDRIVILEELLVTDAPLYVFVSLFLEYFISLP